MNSKAAPLAGSTSMRWRAISDRPLEDLRMSQGCRAKETLRFPLEVRIAIVL